MGCTDSKPVAKPSKAKAKASKIPRQAAAGTVPEATPEVVEAAEATESAVAPPAELCEQGRLTAAEALEAAQEALQEVAAEAEPAMDFLEQEAELPVIPEAYPGIKAEALEDSETTLPKDEESPRLFGRLKVEAAPDLSRGPCVCTNFW